MLEIIYSFKTRNNCGLLLYPCPLPLFQQTRVNTHLLSVPVRKYIVVLRLSLCECVCVCVRASGGP